MSLRRQWLSWFVDSTQSNEPAEDGAAGKIPGIHVMVPDEQPRNEIVTKRLLLRQWRATDRGPFAALSADPRVMKYFPAMLSRTESDAVVDRIEAHWARHGFGFWVVEIPNVDPFIGIVGLLVPRFEAHFT